MPNLGDQVDRSQILPGDRVADRLACLVVPSENCLTLRGDSTSRNLTSRTAGLHQRQRNCGAHALGDRLWSLLDPAGMGVEPIDGLVAVAAHLPFGVDQHGPAATAALV